MQQQDISAYRSLSDIEHVREATDMYLGDFATKSQDKYVLVDNKFVLTKMVCNDAVMKLISEGLDNSVDNSYRDPPTTAIKVEINNERVTISNNGKHLPIEQKGGKWLPTILFTSLRSGSNFNGNRQAAGKNGKSLRNLLFAATGVFDNVFFCIHRRRYLVDEHHEHRVQHRSLRPDQEADFQTKF